MTDKQPDRTEREAFEAWALSQKLGEYTEQMGFQFHAAGDKYPAWKAWQARAALAAPQQAAPAAEWLEQAYREGWAACRDAETIGEEAEDWAFGNSTANSRMIDMQQAAPQQAAPAVPTRREQAAQNIAVMPCNHYRDISGYEEVQVSPWGDTETQWVERYESTQIDISVGAFKCTQCGEVGYYTGKWKAYYENGVKF